MTTLTRLALDNLAPPSVLADVALVLFALLVACALLALLALVPVLDVMTCRWARGRKYRLRARAEADARLMEGR